MLAEQNRSDDGGLAQMHVAMPRGHPCGSVPKFSIQTHLSPSQPTSLHQVLQPAQGRSAQLPWHLHVRNRKPRLSAQTAAKLVIASRFVFLHVSHISPNIRLLWEIQLHALHSLAVLPQLLMLINLGWP